MANTARRPGARPLRRTTAAGSRWSSTRRRAEIATHVPSDVDLDQSHLLCVGLRSTATRFVQIGHLLAVEMAGGAFRRGSGQPRRGLVHTRSNTSRRAALPRTPTSDRAVPAARPPGDRGAATDTTSETGIEGAGHLAHLVELQQPRPCGTSSRSRSWIGATCSTSSSRSISRSSSQVALDRRPRRERDERRRRA